MSREQVGLADLIEGAITAALSAARVAIPATCIDYDPAKKEGTFQPVVKRPIWDADGRVSFEDWPAAAEVPVMFPGGAKLSAHWELQPGDAVDLVFQDLSFVGWRSTGKQTEAFDTRAHGPGSPVAIPWYRPDGGPGEADTDESIGRPGGLRIHFGDAAISVGTGVDYVAMAAKVDARLSALEAGMAGHTHAVAGTLTPPTTVAGTAAPSVDSGVTPGASVASTNLKAD